MEDVVELIDEDTSVESIDDVPVLKAKPVSVPQVKEVCNNSKIKQDIEECRKFGAKGTPGYLKTVEC